MDKRWGTGRRIGWRILAVDAGSGEKGEGDREKARFHRCRFCFSDEVNTANEPKVAENMESVCFIVAKRRQCYSVPREALTLQGRRAKEVFPCRILTTLSAKIRPCG